MTSFKNRGSAQAGNNEILKEFVDFLMPLLKPYETMIYLYLLRRSRLLGNSSIRVGQRTISADCGIGTRSSRGGNQQHVREVLQSLEAKGCIVIGDLTREGTLYSVFVPSEIEAVQESMAVATSVSAKQDYYSDPELRRQLFERDNWICRYCGEVVTEHNATLDHVTPVSKGGADLPENLATACMLCNSIKAGKTYEEAAPLILDAIRRRRSLPGS